METNTQTHKEGSVGAIIASLIIIILLIVAGFYYWGQKVVDQKSNNQATEIPKPTENMALPVASTSDEASAIEADIASTSVDDLDKASADIDANLNF